MASLFLSYARQDAARAEALAKALQRGGHDVWWDRHIHGGSRFTREIDEALKKAEAVVVLWSQASVDSAWVQDEAAEGRDSGRLVPVALDDCKPPLGFRQYQSIDLSSWNGRTNAPALASLHQAISALSPDDGPVTDEEPPPSRSKGRFSLLQVAIAAGILMVLGGLTWHFLDRGWSAQRTTPTIAVLPFSDLSPNADKAYFADGVAEAILNILAKESGIRVLGRSTAQQLHDAGENSQKMRRSLGITHLLEGSARSAGDELRMSVRLIDAADGRQLWAEEYQRRLDNVFAVQDEIGRAVAQRLKGSFAPSTRGARQRTGSETYELYLAARAKVRSRQMSPLTEALALAKQVITADPNFAPGHALYAELIWHLSHENYGNLSTERVRELALPHARRAIELAPNAPEGHAALGVISTGATAVQALTKAIRLDPARVELRLWLARSQQRLGQNSAALEQLNAAIEMDPLWTPAVWNYAWGLAASERFGEAAALIANFEQRGGSRAITARMRAEITGLYRGNFADGVRLATLALRENPETPLARELLAWFYDRLGMSKEGTAIAAQLPLYSRLWIAGNHQLLLEQVTNDGASVWSHPDSEVAIRSLAINGDWTAIVRLTDLNPESLKLPCGDRASRSVQLGIDLATALNIQGRGSQSSQLLACVQRTLDIQGGDSARSFLMSNAVLDLWNAQVLALEGQGQRAFPRLEWAIRRGWRASYGRGLAELPAFDAFKSTSQYGKLDARLKQLIAVERDKVLKMRPAETAIQPA